MEKELQNKKLLILGAYNSEIEIINAAKKMGVYTIVTDNHTNWDDAPAKYAADEAWDISWSDMKALEKKCKEANVDGCMAGFSERRIICAQKLSSIMGMSFYADGADLDMICEKKRFKEACQKCGVRDAISFSYEDDIRFPVIVKPADNGGSRGITICYDREEFEAAYVKAMECSDSKSVVIEEYITADEVMVYYTVHAGHATVSAMCDRYMNKFQKNITQLPVGYYFPSKHLDVLMKFNDEKFQKLISFLGIKNGLIAFQAFVVGNDIIPFDPTYRLDGTMAYHITSEMNNTSVMEMLIRYSLTGSMGEFEEIEKKENPYIENPCFELPVLLTNGTITQIKGMEKVRDIKEVIHIHTIHNVGETMKMKADFSQMLCRIHICAKNDDALYDVVKYIYNNIKVLDENGNDMIIGREICERIRKD